MRLLTRHKEAVALDDDSFRRILDLYPEERLAERPVFAGAIQSGQLEFDALRKEADITIIPWQMFFLDPSKLQKQLQHIDEQRQRAIPAFAAKRKGGGDVTSRRILDRLVRSRSYLHDAGGLPDNGLCGCLRGLSAAKAAEHLCERLGFDPASFRARDKGKALQYLISCAENRQVNVCQGVLRNKILPHVSESRDVYKNTSGLVLAHAKVPFVFLPSEVNPEESDGRQIYTLVYLLVVIGLEAYKYVVRRDLAVAMLEVKGAESLLHEVTTEILLPSAITNGLRNHDASKELCADWSKMYKITPTAVATILLNRGIVNRKEYEMLLERQPSVKRKFGGGVVPIESSVRKFNG